MRPIFILAGMVFTVCGAIGVLLPVLPTVPFLLLAAFCFSKGSTRLHERLLGSAFYKRHIDEYVRRGGLTRQAKGRILTLSTSMMLLSCLLVPNTMVKAAILALLAVKFYIFFVRIPTICISGEAEPLPTLGCHKTEDGCTHSDEGVFL